MLIAPSKNAGKNYSQASRSEETSAPKLKWLHCGEMALVEEIGIATSGDITSVDKAVLQQKKKVALTWLG